VKKLATAIAAVALIGTPAFAADVALKAPPPLPVPVYNWTGWYAGINFGVGLGTSNNATTTTTPLFDDLAQFFPGTTPSGGLAAANSGTAGLNQNGPIGGFQIGYNWQFSPLIVFGIEADIQGADISGHGNSTGTSTESFAGTSLFTKSVTTATSEEALQASFTNAAISANGIDSVTANVNWLGTVRARLGYLVTPNLLLYATGGVAYGGVSASDSLTTNFNLTADSFALAYAQALGPTPMVSVSAVAGPNPSASATASTFASATSNILVSTTVTPNTSNETLILNGSGTNGFTATSIGVPPTSAGVGGASAPGQSTTVFVQTTKPLSVATTTQSFARVSDTKFGGTIGGGFEWMMAPNWSVKAEALYYDLGSVTVSTTSTSSINPITVAASQGAAVLQAFGPPVPGAATSALGAINKFTEAATVSNTVSTRVKFDGVILRVGLNYHFNLM
jgi:opacity protein-like surface antigen